MNVSSQEKNPRNKSDSLKQKRMTTIIHQKIYVINEHCKNEDI